MPLDSEGNVFESVDTREYVLPTGIIELRVLVDTAKAVVRGLVSWRTAVDHAFDITTTCDAWKRLFIGFTPDFKKNNHCNSNKEQDAWRTSRIWMVLHGIYNLAGIKIQTYLAREIKRHMAL